MHTYKARKDNGVWLYVVGYWSPPAWEPLRDCATELEASAWVSYLNGGERPAENTDG